MVQLIQRLPLASLPKQYPSFLSTPGNEPNVLTTTAVPEQLGSLARYTPEHRTALADGIIADLERWNAPQAAREAAEKLRQPNAYAVVTGQQAGIASGPLFTLYKGLGAVAMARLLAEHFPDNIFVPVFWIEGDDHDFNEARTITLLERNGDPRTLRYDDGDERRLHVGDRVMQQEGIEKFLEEVQAILGETDFSADLFARIRQAYATEGRTFADGFARSVYMFLGDTPLVLLSSRSPVLKRLAADVITREIEHPESLYQGLRSRTAELQSHNLPTPIEPKPGGLFITYEGERRSLDIDGDEYVVRGTERRMSRSEAAEAGHRNPELFSPNVALRPVVQDAILPTAIYLAGPSELAYLRQLRDVYPLFGMEQPCVAPRPFVTLMEPKSARLLESSGLSLETLLDPAFDPASHLLDAKKATELAQILERSQKMLQAAFTELEGIAAEIDKSLENTLGAAARKAEKELENIGNRLHASLKRKNETEINRLEGGRALLVPGGKLQERSVNALYYANKYGIERLRETLAQVTIAPGEMQIVEMGG